MDGRSDVVPCTEEMDMGSTTEFIQDDVHDDSAPPTKRRKETPSTNSSGVREIFSFGPPPNTSGKTLSSSSLASPFWVPDSPFADEPAPMVTTPTPTTRYNSSELPNNLKYSVQKRNVRTFKTSAAVDVSYNVQLSQEWEGRSLEEVLKYLDVVFTNVLQLLQGDLTRVVFKHPDLQNPLVVSSREELTANDILKVIEKALTSYADLRITGNFQIIIGVINFPSGSGKRKYVTNLVRDLPSKTSIVEILNNDNLCALRATAVAYTKTCLVHNDIFEDVTKDIRGTNVMKVLESGKAFYRNIRKGDEGKRREQLNMSERLAALAGISTEQPCSIDHLCKLENVIKRNICVIQAEEGNKFVGKKLVILHGPIYTCIYMMVIMMLLYL